MKDPLFAGFLFFSFAAWCALAGPDPAQARPNQHVTVRVGYIGSLTGFAAPYGTAVKEGVELALKDLNSAERRIELFIEDDQSAPKQLAAAYQKLRSLNKIEALITGSWWANSIVHAVERDKIPFLSCETLYNAEYVLAPNYFSLLGYLKDWISVFEPLVGKRGWKSAAMVKFVSGFADTLHHELNRVFSTEGRRFLKYFEYSDFEMKEAATIAARVKALDPQVLYIDAQPQSFAALINRLSEQRIEKLAVLTNPIALDAFNQRLFDPKKFNGQIYFSAREDFESVFIGKFFREYGRSPILNSDLGYYALHLVDRVFAGDGNPVERLRSGALAVDGRLFSFDGNNIYQGPRQQVYTFKEGVPVKASL